MAFQESDAITQIANHERAIAGIKNSYDFARNPDKLNTADLPAVIHYIPNFTAEPRGHFNAWDNQINVTSILCVAPRASQGGKLRWLENEALVFGQKWRNRFQDGTVVNSLLTQLSATKAFLVSGSYGAGGALLTIGDTEYIGWIFQFQIQNA